MACTHTTSGGVSDIEIKTVGKEILEASVVSSACSIIY